MTKSASVAGIALTVALVVGGCGSSVTPSPSSTPALTQSTPTQAVSTGSSTAQPSLASTASIPPVASGSIAADLTLIEAATDTDPASIDALGAIRFTDAGAQAAQQVLVSSATPDQTWAALWIYAASGNDPAPVQPELTNPDPSVSALAAGTLFAMGQSESVATLRGALGDVTSMRDSEPPISIQAYALQTLTQYVDAPDAPDSSTATDDQNAADQWETWLGAHAAQLQFDTNTGVWAAP